MIWLTRLSFWWYERKKCLSTVHVLLPRTIGSKANNFEKALSC